MRFWDWLKGPAKDKRDVRIRGRVEVIRRVSSRNSKLEGYVDKYLDTEWFDIGSNLVVEGGRRMSAGLLAGTLGIAAGIGFAESTGHVIRGMALGEGTTPEDDDDDVTYFATGGLQSPVPTPPGHYFELNTPIEFPVSPGSRVTFVNLFDENQPDALTRQITEYGLYTGSPGPAGPLAPYVPPGSRFQPPVTTPPGPAAGYALFARKTHGIITKSPNFTMTVRWSIEF